MPRQIVGKKPTFPEPRSQTPMLRAEISQARLLPYYSAPRDSLFTFQYRVDLTNNSADWLTITRRYWEFDDAGEVIKVEAVSVGGQMLPRIAPGQTHSYVTAVPFHVPFGQIRGRFSAQIEGGGETFAEVEPLRFEASLNDIRTGDHNRAAPNELALAASLNDLTAIGKWTRESANTSGNDNQPKQLRTDELAVSRETRQHLERWILKSFYVQYDEFSENNASRSLVKFSDIHSSFCDVFISDVFMLKGKDSFYVILDYAPNVHRILQRSLDGRAERGQRLPLLGKVPEDFYLALAALLEREGVNSVARARILDEMRLVAPTEGTRVSLLNGIFDGKNTGTDASAGWKTTVSTLFDSQFSHLSPTDRAKAEAVFGATFSASKAADTAKLDILLQAAQTEPEQPAAKKPAPSSAKLNEAELAEFKAHATTHPWRGRSGISASQHIRKEFAPWLGRGLRRSDIKAIHPELAGAYAVEIHRYPDRRIPDLVEGPKALPTGSPRPLSVRLAADLSEEELQERRRLDRIRKAGSYRPRTPRP